MNRIFSITLLLALALGLAGCPGKKSPVKPPATAGETVSGTGGTASAAAAGDAGKAQPLPGSASGAQDANAAALAKTTIYFDFDSSEIRPEFAATVAAHGRKLGGERTLKVRLEGNTDERGSAEYNVALGERRAQAVKKALLLQGASEAQLTTVSYGEERPVADGHDEQAWTQNRRVEIVYPGAR